MDHNQRLAADIRRVTVHVGAVVLACLLSAWLAGKLNPAAPVEWNKVLSGTGGSLAAWGTYFGLQPFEASWTELRPDEVKRKRILRWTFLPGALLSILGAIW